MFKEGISTAALMGAGSGLGKAFCPVQRMRGCLESGESESSGGVLGMFIHGLSVWACCYSVKYCTQSFKKEVCRPNDFRTQHVS